MPLWSYLFFKHCEATLQAEQAGLSSVKTVKKCKNWWIFFSLSLGLVPSYNSCLLFVCAWLAVVVLQNQQSVLLLLENCKDWIFERFSLSYQSLQCVAQKCSFVLGHEKLYHAFSNKKGGNKLEHFKCCNVCKT